MVKIKFLTTVIYETQGRNKGPEFKQGSVHEVSEALARKWVDSRGVAERVDEAESKQVDNSQPTAAKKTARVDAPRADKTKPGA